ncbi:MAG: hypothetical protein AB7T32_08775, partial [Dehalococcoidia bacterium]
DSATGKIAVKSGTLELSVTGEEEDTYILLPIDTDNCPTATAMGPGYKCRFDVTVKNTGTLPLRLHLENLDVAGGPLPNPSNPMYGISGTSPCFTAGWIWPEAEPDLIPPFSYIYTPGEEHSGYVEIQMVTAANNDCQDKSASWTVGFKAFNVEPQYLP